MTSQELERQTAAGLDALRRELEPEIPPERVTTVGHQHFERLRCHATVTDFIPLLVYRLTREELLYGETVALEDVA
jgi:hypothetical protein